MYFAAVELKPGEAPEDAVRHFVTVAAEQGIRFKKLQTFGQIEYACSTFIRFRTDCPTYPPVITRMRIGGRSVIAPMVTGYRLFLANGKEGQVNCTLMQGVPLPGYSKVYIGPSHEHWQAQFRAGSGQAMAEAPRG